MAEYKTKIINLFGGPGSGKSTIAAEVFARMKKLGYAVELVNEVAKDIVHEQHMGYMMAHQDKISAEQNYRQARVCGIYEYVVTDSPILLGIFYTPDGYYPSFQRLVIEKFQSYDNINIYLDRTAEYDPRGRYQDEDGANALSQEILNYLKNEGIPFYWLPANDTTVESVMSILQVHGTQAAWALMEHPTVGKYGTKYPKYYINHAQYTAVEALALALKEKEQ